jgi:hypothetical protein
VIIKILKKSPIKKNPLKMRRDIRDLKAVSTRKGLNLKGTRDNQFKYFSRRMV